MKRNHINRLSIALLTLLTLTSFTYATGIEKNKTILINNYKFQIQSLDTDMSQEMKSAKDTINMNFSYGLGMNAKTIFSLEFTARTLQDTVDRGLQMSKWGNALTYNSLDLALRDMKLGYLSSLNTMKVNEIKVSNQTKQFNQLSQKYKLGLITKLELEEAQLHLRTMTNELQKSMDALTNMGETLLNFMGETDIAVLESIKFEAQKTTSLNPLEFYFTQSENRFDIVSLISNIEQAELKVPIYELLKYDLYTSQTRDFDRNSANIQIYQHELALKRELIKNEISIAYQSVLSAEKQIKSLRRTVEVQSERLKQMEAMYQLGHITESDLNSFEVVIKELKNSLNLAIYDYNSKRKKLDYAVSVGPAY